LLPGGSIVKGELQLNYDPIADLALLDQDILEVELPTGFTIDVGWFPQYDPAGRFRIAVKDRAHQVVGTPTELRDPRSVALTLADLANAYGAPRTRTQSASTTEIRRREFRSNDVIAVC